ncbi:MerR family transcriptional regulator [Actinokineospora guangxiensis]|uniref:MerR family transcriptional regulator n=1 Tax=Actinokineospora guangxiensis TaxID=1490288 RepID=A0ABW0ENV4_9PSEU
MRISQFATRTGVPATTLRFYEAEGLLPAKRTPSGYRVYDEDDFQRLTFISVAKNLGLALEDIAELLPVWESGACREVRADLRQRVAARIADAERRTIELATFATALRGALGHLDALPDRVERCDPECAFLDPAPATLAPRVPRWRTAAVACSLAADGVAERAERWQDLLAGGERDLIDDGLRVVVPADRASQVAALAVDEQRCCPFFDFRLHLDGPELVLEVRAPADGAALLDQLFGAG